MPFSLQLGLTLLPRLGRQCFLHRAVGQLCLLAERPHLRRQPIDLLVKEGLEVYPGPQVVAGLVEKRAQASGDLGPGAARLVKTRPHRGVEADELCVPDLEHARWLLG